LKGQEYKTERANH
jgi:hypothetical protein